MRLLELHCTVIKFQHAGQRGFNSTLDGRRRRRRHDDDDDDKVVLFVSCGFLEESFIERRI